MVQSQIHFESETDRIPDKLNMELKERHLIKEDVQKANMYMKRCFTSYVIGGITN